MDTEEDVPVVLPLEDAIDLHAFRPAETASVVEEYLAEAAVRGFDEVRIVHGRGVGTQRRIVRAVLARSPLVVEFRDAPPERGGWGATVARLRPGGAVR
ncbi:MAG TPA: Smr/MutS family protein [Thermoanaerobaculia bacterium]|nr:Smr/MutS family protein [Thermoanaerobaculia bacterium]HQN08192.1 Smr/MutS family protein [Thermoanaerobaculia bacterium]HQP85881.1 Smr/MutS family protein [Thermoanaerobaculia bacterium]